MHKCCNGPHVTCVRLWPAPEAWLAETLLGVKLELREGAFREESQTDLCGALGPETEQDGSSFSGVSATAGQPRVI